MAAAVGFAEEATGEVTLVGFFAAALFAFFFGAGLAFGFGS
jgi:hypothetical protein